ncbi:MAG: sensor histidine kinase [Thermodesulfobacteriota bacterium]
MFLKNPKLLFKSNSFKLITWYTIFFILSSLIINIYAYSVISSFIYKQSREEILEDFDEIDEFYKQGGLESVIEDTADDKDDFIRITGSDGENLFLIIPDNWKVNNKEIIQNSRFGIFEELELPEIEESENEYEVISKKLVDGSILQLGQETLEREELLRKIRKVYLIAIIPIILFAYLGGVFITDRALNPIRDLLKTLNSIVASARIDTRVSVEHGDNLYSELSALFNTMLDKIETLIKGLRDVLDNVAHDLRTPITRLRATAEMALQSDESNSNLKEALGDCLEESERILITLNTLMDVSEAETGAIKLNPVEINISPVIDGIVELYSYVAEVKKISINTNYPKELYIIADKNWIRQVIANLVDNAIKYTPAGGKIEIETTKGEKEAVITVKDTGVGIPNEELQNIWERLYRGDKSRSERGLGLGLSLVKAIVGAHNGHVEVTSKPGFGSKFSVYLPMYL